MGQIEGSQASRLSRSGSQAKCLHHRIAGVSPACGCTQPLVSEVYISTVFLFAFRQSAGETPAIRRSRMLFRIAGETPPTWTNEFLEIPYMRIRNSFLNFGIKDFDFKFKKSL
jgi:hypothetical protein